MMCSSKWPVLLDLTRDESKKILRSLELEAYGTVVSAFRAQGNLTKNKKKLLQDMQNMLSISTERHRAELRRAVNDEKLTTVADCLSGPDVSSEWHIEGRRLVPIVPRLVPQTAFTATADRVADVTSQHNATLPPPVATGNRERAGSSAPPPQRTIANPAPISHAPISSHAPASNVVVLPSGMSIHIKEEAGSEDETLAKPRRRNSSLSENLLSSRQQLLQPPPIPMLASSQPTRMVSMQSSHVSVPHHSSPMKFPVAKSPVKQHAVTTTPSGQKVIIVSSTMSSSGMHNTATVSQGGTYLQRAVSAVPIVKPNPSVTPAPATTTVNTMVYPKSSIMVSGSATPGEYPGGRSNIITIATTNSNAERGVPVSNVPPMYHSQPTPVGMAPRPRVRTITARPRTPQHAVRAPSYPPPASQPVGTPTSQNIHIRPSSSRPTIHIKQEGGMKIITQGAPTAGRILPKPAASQVLVVTTAPQTVSMVTKAVTVAPGTHTQLQQGGKVLNISTSGGRILATSTPRSTGANVVTVNPKTLQLTTLKGTPGGTTVLTTGSRITTATGTTKPNVIVVQKAAPKRGGVITTPTVQVARSTTGNTTPFEKELVSFLQRQDPAKTGVTPIQRSILDKRLSRLPDGQTRKHVLVRQKSEGGTIRSVTLPGTNKSILAELIQAVGTDQVVLEDSNTGASITSGEENSEGSSLQPNQWVEYDVQSSGGSTYLTEQATKIITSEATDASAIKALLDLQAGTSTPRPKLTIQRSISETSGNLQESRVTTDEPDSPEIQITATQGLADSLQNSSVKPSFISQIRPKMQVMDESGSRFQLQIANPEEMSQLATLSSQDGEVREVIGEIDPRSLYSSDLQVSELDEGVSIQVISSEDHEAEQAALLSESQATKTIIISSANENNPSSSIYSSHVTTVLDANSVVPEPATTAADFLSRALNQAQINLDSYHFVEDNGGKSEPSPKDSAFQHVYVAGSGDGEENQSTLVSILNRPSSSAYTSAGSETTYTVDERQQNKLPVSQIQMLDHQDNLPDLLVSTPDSSLAAGVHRTQARLGGNVLDKSVLITPQARGRTQFIPMQDVEKRAGISTIHVIKSSISSTSETRSPALYTSRVSSNVSVATEVSSLDPGHLKLEDLTSQQQLEADLSAEEMHQGYSSGDASHLVRLSKRKRKAPLPADEVTSPSHHTGWQRYALTLLQRVMRVRGTYKEKGQMNAAAWFTQPVDIHEVPDYYEIIENPMDFGTIKRKLELGHYLDIEDYRSDVLLVRDNCHRYNPAGTEVRRDCDEVFSFFIAEYDKLLQRFQQAVISSPGGKKQRIDRSPIRH